VKIISSILILLLLSIGIYAQKYTISGYIEDEESGEKLIYANIYLDSTHTGTASNSYGFYSLTLEKGIYTIVYSYTGYSPQKTTLNLNHDTIINTKLTPGNQLSTVEISARAEKIELNTQMSVIKVPVKSIKNLPAILGETDVLKVIQLMPGVQSGTEASSGLYVRGGGADQNLILLDGAPLYNVSHLFGFFSVFNPDAINNIELIKGGFPARYGGRLSSVLEINMKEGNMKKFQGAASIGSISSKLTLEGPIIKDKMSFIVSGRRTYVDLFLKASSDEAIKNNKLFFYDLNAKYNWRINDKNRIFVSGYFGRDVFAFGNAFGTDWGNTTATARWNRLFSSKMFANFTFVYSDFNYSLGVPSGAQAFDWNARIRDFSLKSDFTNYINPNNTLQWGAIATHHNFLPGEIIPGSDESIFNPLIMPDKNAMEYAAYVSNEQKIGEKITLSYGLRYSAFSQIGSGRVFNYDSNGEVIDTTTLSRTRAARGHTLRLEQGERHKGQLYPHPPIPALNKQQHGKLTF